MEYQDAKGRLLGKDSKVSAPSTVTVTVYGKGNYYGKNSVTYRIVGKKMNIAKAKVSVVEGKKWYYSGENITINEEDLIVRIGDKTLLPENYEIVGHSNNVKKGTATAIIRGKGEYGGTKQVKFKINRQIMKWWEKKSVSVMLELLNW